MSKVRFLISGFVIVLAWTVLAGKAAAFCSGTSCFDVQIGQVYVANTGDVFISVPDDVTQLSCTPVGNYIKLAAAHNNVDRIYAALLSLKLSSHPVRLVMVPGTGNCELDYIYWE